MESSAPRGKRQSNLPPEASSPRMTRKPSAAAVIESKSGDLGVVILNSLATDFTDFTDETKAAFRHPRHPGCPWFIPGVAAARESAANFAFIFQMAAVCLRAA